MQPKPDPQVNSGAAVCRDNSPILLEEVEGFSESMKGRRKYRDVADAAQAAFESAAYAAAAARAAVELSCSESLDSDDQNSPRNATRGNLNSKFQTNERDSRFRSENKYPTQTYDSESEDEEVYIGLGRKGDGLRYRKNPTDIRRSESDSSSDYESGNEGKSISSRG